MPSPELEPEDGGRLRPLLRRADQLAVALVIAFSLLLITISLIYRHRRHDGIIEIDRSPPRQVQFLVDINRADWPELTLLPGIGPTLARRIIESRERAGAFRNTDDLQRVPGIGPKTVARIAPYLMPVQDAETAEPLTQTP